MADTRKGTATGTAAARDERAVEDATAPELEGLDEPLGREGDDEVEADEEVEGEDDAVEMDEADEEDEDEDDEDEDEDDEEAEGEEAEER
jgi:hypothetical protein